MHRTMSNVTLLAGVLAQPADGATILDIDILGAKDVKLADGVRGPLAGDILGGTPGKFRRIP